MMLKCFGRRDSEKSQGKGQSVNTKGEREEDGEREKNQKHVTSQAKTRMWQGGRRLWKVETKRDAERDFQKTLFEFYS